MAKISTVIRKSHQPIRTLFEEFSRNFISQEEKRGSVFSSPSAMAKGVTLSHGLHPAVFYRFVPLETTQEIDDHRL